MTPRTVFTGDEGDIRIGLIMPVSDAFHVTSVLTIAEAIELRDELNERLAIVGEPTHAKRA